MIRARCDKGCIDARNACDADSRNVRAVCDTRAILCHVACPKCAAEYPVCRARSSPDGSINQLSIMRCTGESIECQAAARKDADAHPPITFAGGDGSAAASAIIVLGARNSSEGIVAELIWAARNRPGWTKTGQRLISRDGRRYDLIRYRLPDGSQSELYFDITDFFGKS